MSHTYVITGANRGIGLELARQLTGRGDHVIATARRGAEVADLLDIGARIEALDVSDDASVTAFAQRMSGDPVDVLINNAGTAPLARQLADLDFEVMLATFSTNAIGPIRLAQALMPNLKAGRRRVIVNLSTEMASIAGNRSGGYYSYRASKAALNMLTKTLAVELTGKGFSCVAVNPGWVKTRMGGPHAPLPVEDSVTALVKLIDRLTVKDSGNFLSYDGSALAW
jgi:NAD(P)-dependent dehydrogenase (short-subunit alcohol dehydrogenase family)